MAELLKYAVIDGGLTTEVIDTCGYDWLLRDKLWSARLLSTDPSAIQNVSRRFLEAGADIIGTATYQATVEGFQKHLGLTASEALQLIKSGVHIAQQTRDEFWKHNNSPDRVKPLVAGCISPYGSHKGDGSEYHGNYVESMSLQELVDWHRPVVQALVEAGADIVALESIPAQKEAEALIELLKEFPDTRAWLCFTCKDGEHIVHGERLADALKLTVPSQQVVAVGVNCSSPLHIESLLKTVPAEVSSCKKLAVYPNSGEEWLAEEHVFSGREQSTRIAPLVASWLDSGANWIGGCCRTTANDIVDIRAEMTSWLDKHNKR